MTQGNLFDPPEPRLSMAGTVCGPLNPPDPLEPGRAARDAGVDAVESRTPDWWRNLCDHVIAALAATGKEFSAVDVRALCGDPPNHFNAMGARFLAAARAGIVVRVGYRPSSRATLHAHPITIWRGAVSAPGATVPVAVDAKENTP